MAWPAVCDSVGLKRCRAEYAPRHIPGGYHGGLHDLAKSREYLGRGQSGKATSIRQHCHRKMKCPDLILKPGEIHPRLPPYRRIHGAKQSGRHIDMPDTALEYRCRKPSEIRHHPSTHAYEY